LTEEQKAMSEFFNNKKTIIGTLLDHSVPYLGLDQEGLAMLAAKFVVAVTDTLTAVWREKTRYNAPRPFTAIRHLYNNKTIRGYSRETKMSVNDMPAAHWESYIPSANHPEYPSATAAFCGAYAEILRLEAGTDDTRGFNATVRKGSSSREANQPSEDLLLTFDTWTQWENDCANSRFWAGMHFKDATTEGLKLGHQYAKLGNQMMNDKINHSSKEVDERESSLPLQQTSLVQAAEGPNKYVNYPSSINNFKQIRRSPSFYTSYFLPANDHLTS